MNLHSPLRAALARAAVLASLLGMCGLAGAASLANQPVFATSNVPGNLALALSVEWPTASRTAHTAAYTSASTYLGYFDPGKCYAYVYNAARNDTNTGDTSYFNPAAVATNRRCSGLWSGNFLNWAATATIDPFRWAMTGGRRVVDTPTETILEKGWHSGQGGLFDDRSLATAEIAGATPFSTASSVGIIVNGGGFGMRVTTQRLLRGEYFNNLTLAGTPVLTVANDSAYHNWGNASPGAGVNSNDFSARFTGNFVAPESGTYIFRVRADDGVRLWVNNIQLVNAWIDQGTTAYEGSVNLTRGQEFDVRVEYYDSGQNAVMELGWRTPSAGNFQAFTDGTGTYDLTMRNRVCVPNAPGGVEANCKQYRDGWKPEGLIQQYSRQMRFSAFGYLNESGNGRDGGVMRARQKFVGPVKPVPGLPDAANTGQLEWSQETGVLVRNPDEADANATAGGGVSDSGVINYLNKFGQLIPGNYKDNDPVGELYYAALRYYRNLGNVPEWSDLRTNDAATIARRRDGFPVITNWDDPIQYSCQRNFVLGIGDIYTHGDKNVPGNTNNADEPGMPSLVTNDTRTPNAVTATNRVGVLQSMGADLGTRTNVSENCCSNNSARMAGMAYDANTRDIRPDSADSPATIGKQTVQTYWVDVLERDFQRNNQFYLASKYGGMTVPAAFDPDAALPADIQQNWWSTTGETLTDTRTSPDTVQPRPDNYFTAGRPDAMVSGLSRAFASIANAIKAFTTSFSLSTVQVSSLGAASYASQYDSNGWTGVLTASNITFAADGTPTATQVWSTAGPFEAQMAGAGWNTGRRVVTWNGTAGVPFRSDSITSAQFATLDSAWESGDDSANYLNYLRGDRTYERTSAGDSTRPYRHRTALLGDIVNAKVTPVGPPDASLSDAINPGYAAFKTTWTARPTMVYVGANDGMLHAFNGALTGAGAGTEQFAYVPSPLFAGPTGQPQINGLAQLGNPNYEHRYYVDATPQSFDIDFNHTFGGTNLATKSAANADWRSVLIGGLGKGGKSYYAIDITNPASMTTEDVVRQKVMWEFTDATMGYSYGAPIVIKTRKYGWVAVLTSGYVDASGGGDGYGYIYFVNPRTGVLLEKVRTTTTSAGLAQATAYVTDFTDGTADAIYVGDLNGQMWRFDVTAALGTVTSYPSPLRLATVTDGTGAAQPITTQPLVEIDPRTKRRYLMFGTGQLLDTIDVNSSAGQTFYAIVDGGVTNFGTAADLPAGISFPIRRVDLTDIANSDLISGDAIPFAGKAGWRIDLGVNGTGPNAIAWRMTTNPTSLNGVVAFTTLLTTGNACSPSGQSRIYAVDFGAGKSVLAPDSAPFLSFTAAITDLKFLGVDGKARLVAGDVEGKLDKVGVRLGGANTLRLLNWREIPTLD